MKIIKAADITLGLEHARREYALKLNTVADRVQQAQAKLDNGRVSTHDGFNLSASCGELQELAARIELMENLVRFAEEAA